jgi:hypothetical protein
MKKTILRYGIISGIFLLVFFQVTHEFFKNYDYSVKEIFGYGSIVLATVFVFIGIKYFRDKINNGWLSFGQGMKLGVLITLFPAVLFGIWTLIFTYYLEPDYYDKYFSAQTEQLRKSLPADEFAVKVKEMESFKELSANPAFAFGLMFITVFLIGLIITIISTFILKRKPKTSIA